MFPNVFIMKHKQHKQTKPDKALGKHPSHAHWEMSKAGISPADHWV